jgi:hypothetical protein
MYGTEAGVCESKATEETCDSHVGARGSVATVLNCSTERTGGTPNSFDAEGVGERIGAGGNVRFDQLSERVQTSRGSE